MHGVRDGETGVREQAMEIITTLRRKYENSTNKEKTCKKCEKTYPATTNFFYPVSKKDSTRGLYPRCIRCENERSEQWRQNNKEKKRKKDIAYKSSEIGYFKELWNGVRKSPAGNEFKDFDEFFQCWIDQQKIYGRKCPYFGFEMTRIRGLVSGTNARHVQTYTNISRDRILSDFPYSKKNIMFVSWKANNQKGNISLDVAKKFIKFAEERFNED